MAEETQKVAEEAKVEAPVQEAPKAEAPAKKTSLNASVASDKFDWDAFEGGAEIYGGEDKKSIEDAYDQTLSKIVENEVVGRNRYRHLQERGYRQHRLQERGCHPGP